MSPDYSLVSLAPSYPPIMGYPLFIIIMMQIIDTTLFGFLHRD